MKVKMPFKLRLKKTRQYNVLSRNVLVISVELLDKTTLECTLSADSTGQDCLHNVCQRLSLHQPEFFGLRYMSKKPYPKVRWVELDRPLKKQLDKYAQSPALALAVLYYIHDVSLLQDDVTRSHYFLQVKQDVLEGKLRCNHEQAVLLASYSLQAEFGDHQPDRHTAEYLKDFMLFPKQVGNDGEVAALLEAVVWQYSSLQGLAQALAETYYILEAQRLDGYGQETFMARDERGSEVYLGTSLMGIDVRPAAGHTHIFYRWNDITNLVNNKRNFGIECQRTDETVHFTFDEPDAAKYVWKMCVKQHTFYKRNQEVLEGSNSTDTRSLAIPDLQSSVMTAQLHHLGATHDMVDSRGGLGEMTLRSSGDPALASFTTTLPQFDMSYIQQPGETSSHLGPAVESSSSQIMNDPSYGLLSQSAFSLNASHHPQQNQVVIASHSQVSQPSALQQQSQQQQRDGGQQVALYSSNLSLPSARGSFRRSLLPQYRPAPDYETALIQKYGPGVNPANVRATMLYSSQPEISNSHVMEGNAHELSQPAGGVSSYSHYKGYTDLSIHPDPAIPQLSRSAGILMPGPLHNTYSPELATGAGEVLEGGSLCGDAGRDQEHELLHVYKPPPPYPYNKPSSNSTPDLATINQGGNMSPDLASRRRALLTASLGCLGSPDLSRTYENLADLSEAVESLRNDLTRTTETGNTIYQSLHSFSHNYSCNDLDAIYQLSDGRVAVGANLNLNPVFTNDQSSQPSQQKQQGATPQYTAPPHYNSQFTAQYTDPQYPSGAVQGSQEPIYQNIAALRTDESRERTRSAPEIDNNAMNVVGAAQGNHLIGQLGSEDVQGGRSRALSQPVRQSAIDPQIYIENRLGEQQRGPIEAINTAMGQIPVFSAQQELRHNHHHHLQLQQQMQALSLQQQQQLQQQLQLQQQKEQQLQQQMQMQQKKEQQQLQQLQAQQQQSAQILSQSSHHHLQQQQMQHQMNQQRQQQVQEQQRQQIQEQHRQQDQQRQQQAQEQQRQQAQEQRQQQIQEQRQQQHQKQLQQQMQQQQQQQASQKLAQQQQLRQQSQAVGVTQQVKQQSTHQRETGGDTSAIKNSPRKKWGAPPSGSLLLAGQSESVLPSSVSAQDTPTVHNAGLTKTREATADSLAAHDASQSKTREASTDFLTVRDTTHLRTQETSTDSHTVRDLGQVPMREAVVADDVIGSIDNLQGAGTSNGGTPDVLRGATLSKAGPKDPRSLQLEAKLLSGDILQEFELIPRMKPNADFTTATKPDNIPRNRYKDIVPYEENRVKITPTKDNKYGYINASHITASVGESQRFYICCQGPLANTVAHFWQCVWEADVYLVVMLTSVTGDTATSKSFPYWPQTDNTSVECGQYRVMRKHSTVSGSHVTSRLQVVHVPARKTRTIWHLQFTDWADHGCPEDILGYISFLEELSTLRRYTYQEVRGVGRNRNTPVLVHCSAGVGRSGVTILCDLLLEATDHNLPLDPPKVLLHLRQQRMVLVQTIAQYKFVYQVLLAYLNRARLI
ncbi:tyrosine-protein phosphatase non-receptor type 14 isoform X2 [Procambarus clarkii]|uniref:tyrosine-protein phosphatase non-receptor type 14 isoform X2 n=1 Tax=Procambarus clarkii TaxID=6728 RepID=UPI001E6778F9|nr:tyrosine-protein phosphatase non-receptor type 14-like isoform X2 [Procambarus clarkii]